MGCPGRAARPGRTAEEAPILAIVASVVATAVSAVFAVALLRRYTTGRHGTRALAYWGVALAMFSAASLMLLLGVVAGWSSATFRAFYLFGAVLNVPWLALGSVAINARSRAVSRVTGAVTLVGALLFVPGVLGVTPLLWLPGLVLAGVWGLVQLGRDAQGVVAGSVALVAVLTVVGVFAVLSAGLRAPLPSGGVPEGAELFPVAVRGLAVAGNAVGATIVIVGAVASSANLVWARPDPAAAVMLRREARRAPVEALARWIFRGRRGAHVPHLVRGNLLIAAGVLVAAAGGALSFLGETTGHAVGIAVGVSVMFAGFVRTTRPALAGPS